MNNNTKNNLPSKKGFTTIGTISLTLLLLINILLLIMGIANHFIWFFIALAIDFIPICAIILTFVSKILKNIQ